MGVRPRHRYLNLRNAIYSDHNEFHYQILEFCLQFRNSIASPAISHPPLLPYSRMETPQPMLLFTALSQPSLLVYGTSLAQVSLHMNVAIPSLLVGLEFRVASFTFLDDATTLHFLIGLHRVPRRTICTAQSVKLCDDPQITHLCMLAEAYVQCVQEPLKI